MIRLTGGNALVTGAGGFVGAHLVRALAERGARVQGLGSEPEPEGLGVVAWHAADVTRLDDVVAAVRSAAPDVIVHLAGQASAGRSFEHPAESFRVNAVGTWNLLEATRRGAPSARVLIVGSGEIYGPQPEGTRADEATPLAPVSPYALSKAAADVFAEAAARHGLDVVRTRSFAHTGPGQLPPFVIPSWAQQIAAIESGAAEPALRVGNLEVTRDLCDVRDIVRGYVALLERGRGGAAYNLCRGAGVRLDEVARRMTERARTPVRIEADPARARPTDVRYLVGDPSAIEREIGWRAEIPLETTLDEVLEEWRARGASGDGAA